ncbi:transposase, partial [Kocuria sp. ZOR0020]|uniref:transposase n=1 Tax=Kocuria sp. ZOR0020 TaxID=1339234 RepID=UPI0012E02B81
MPEKFTPEFRERTVRMVFDHQATEGGPRAASIRVVAESLGCGPETLRAWCNQAITASKATPAPATDESLGEENRRLGTAAWIGDILTCPTVRFPLLVASFR